MEFISGDVLYVLYVHIEYSTFQFSGELKGGVLNLSFDGGLRLCLFDKGEGGWVESIHTIFICENNRKVALKI